MKLEHRDPTTLNPYEGNARFNADTVSELVQDIPKYGFNNPIVIDKRDTIINGHARVKAAIELKLKEIPCVVVNLTEYQGNEYRIIDNKISELSSWDETKLLTELRSFENVDKVLSNFDEKIDKAFQEDIGAKYRPVDQQAIDQLSGKMDNHFKDTFDKREQTNIHVVCEHCNTPFSFRGR